MLYQTRNPHGGDIYAGDICLDFSANTNPYGTPPGILKAIEASLPEIHRYPDPFCRALVQAIAVHEQLPEPYIFCGNGAADLIYTYCEAVRPKRALELAPTFAEYSLALERLGCHMDRYVLQEEKNFQLEEQFLRELDDRRPEVIFLCNPNNPTGQLCPQGLLEAILRYCAEHNIRLFIDECFLDLADGSMSLKSFLTELPQLFLLKAFTKSYGMAGLRLGYGLTADTELLRQMSQMSQPWNVSTLAQTAGIAALKEQAFLQRTRMLIAEERAWLTVQLRQLGAQVCPSCANYLLFRGPEGLDQELRKRGVAIRNCSNYYGLGIGWYRIAVRLREENEELIRRMREVELWQRTS